ncbi:hypothetical protein Anapl_08884 [Anas platyrhynchos]|uniref:Uncharacterized protein n=1 Tax=Anas platyrhynchos TaxID=8839 RepID=R0K9V5_ANAPL|nr:hypothetical protein Anapl_08884 [Anas platyrhynchos]
MTVQSSDPLCSWAFVPCSERRRQSLPVQLEQWVQEVVARPNQARKSFGAYGPQCVVQVQQLGHMGGSVATLHPMSSHFILGRTIIAECLREHLANGSFHLAVLLAGLRLVAPWALPSSDLFPPGETARREVLSLLPMCIMAVCFVEELKVNAAQLGATTSNLKASWQTGGSHPSLCEQITKVLVFLTLDFSLLLVMPPSACHMIELSLGFLEFVHIYSASADKAGFIHADFHSQGHYMDGKGKLKSRLITQPAEASEKQINSQLSKNEVNYFLALLCKNAGLAGITASGFMRIKGLSILVCESDPGGEGLKALVISRPAQNAAAGNNASGQKATHFSVLKALAGKELSGLNDQLEMVVVLFDTQVDFSSFKAARKGFQLCLKACFGASSPSAVVVHQGISSFLCQPSVHKVFVKACCDVNGLLLTTVPVCIAVIIWTE